MSNPAKDAPDNKNATIAILSVLVVAVIFMLSGIKVKSEREYLSSTSVLAG